MTTNATTCAFTNNSRPYNRQSVERAFAHHGVTFTRRGNGYVIDTSIGMLKLATLRDAYIFVVAMAEKGRRIQKAGAA